MYGILTLFICVVVRENQSVGRKSMFCRENVRREGRYSQETLPTCF